MALTKAQREEREANHKHFLRCTTMWVHKMTYSCVNFEDSDKDWGCNYMKTYSKQWIRDRVTGVPIKEKVLPRGR